VPDDHGGVLFKGVEKSHHVTDKMEERVLVDSSGAIGLPITSHIGRNCVEAGIGENRQLVPPGIP
jgi:hypothetical protein